MSEEWRNRWERLKHNLMESEIVGVNPNRLKEKVGNFEPRGYIGGYRGEMEIRRDSTYYRLEVWERQQLEQYFPSGPINREVGKIIAMFSNDESPWSGLHEGIYILGKNGYLGLHKNRNGYREKIKPKSSNDIGDIIAVVDLRNREYTEIYLH